MLAVLARQAVPAEQTEQAVLAVLVARVLMAVPAVLAAGPVFDLYSSCFYCPLFSNFSQVVLRSLKSLVI